MLWLGRQRIKCTLNCKSPKGQFAAYFRKELKKKTDELGFNLKFRSQNCREFIGVTVYRITGESLSFPLLVSQLDEITGNP